MQHRQQMQHIQHPRQSRSARTRPLERRVTAACAQPRYARLHTVANEETSNPESMTGESADVEHVNSPIAGVSIHGLENQEIGNSDVHQEGQIGAVRTKLPNYASKTADYGHVRGEYYVFPATTVQKPWPKLRHGHN